MQPDADPRLGFWRKMAVRYLLAQGLGTALFWVYLFARPSARSMFWPFPEEQGLLAFFPPDLLFFVIASIAAAVGLERKARWAKPLTLMVSGATAYAGLYTVLIWLMTGRAWAAAALMAVPMVAPAYLSWRMWR